MPIHTNREGAVAERASVPPEARTTPDHRWKLRSFLYIPSSGTVVRISTGRSFKRRSGEVLTNFSTMALRSETELLNLGEDRQHRGVADDDQCHHESRSVPESASRSRRNSSTLVPGQTPWSERRLSASHRKGRRRSRRTFARAKARPGRRQSPPRLRGRCVRDPESSLRAPSKIRRECPKPPSSTLRCTGETPCARPRADLSLSVCPVSRPALCWDGPPP